MRRVAITGGTGFVGRALVAHHLAIGDEVRVLSRGRTPGMRDGVAVVEGDLRDASPDSLVRFAEGADVLYHCAGELRDPTRMRELHVGGTRSLLAAASGRIGRWVQLSSVGVYGPIRAGTVDECAPIAPVGCYEETKAEADCLVLDADASGRVEVVVVRPSIIFGEEMPNRSLYQLATMVKRGLFFFIGAPGASANYIHVSSVVEALVRCATLPQAASRIYNLSDWRTMEQFVGAIAAALGCAVPRWRVPERVARFAGALGDKLPAAPLTSARVAALSSRARYSVRRIETELGFRPPITMEAAIEQVCRDWWRVS